MKGRARCARPGAAPEQAPPTFGGASRQAIEFTVECPGQDPVTLPGHISWFNGFGEVSEDGLRIEGQSSGPGVSASFLFARP